MLVPGKMQHVICTGNINAEQYEELRDLAPNVHVVQGDQDFLNTEMEFPETTAVQVGSFRIGVVHGHQCLPWKDQSALARMRRKLHCDVLISGHTHQNAVVENDGCYHINPVSAESRRTAARAHAAFLPCPCLLFQQGSITGAYSSISPQATPSFILLAVQGDKVVCYVYELAKGEVEVSKTEFSKRTPVDAAALGV